MHSAAIVFHFASAGFNLEHVGQSKTCEHFLEGDLNFAKCGNLRPGNGGKVKEKVGAGLSLAKDGRLEEAEYSILDRWLLVH